MQRFFPRKLEKTDPKSCLYLAQMFFFSVMQTSPNPDQINSCSIKVTTAEFLYNDCACRLNKLIATVKLQMQIHKYFIPIVFDSSQNYSLILLRSRSDRFQIFRYTLLEFFLMTYGVDRM